MIQRRRGSNVQPDVQSAGYWSQQGGGAVNEAVMEATMSGPITLDGLSIWLSAASPISSSVDYPGSAIRPRDDCRLGLEPILWFLG